MRALLPPHRRVYKHVKGIEYDQLFFRKFGHYRFCFIIISIPSKRQHSFISDKHENTSLKHKQWQNNAVIITHDSENSDWQFSSFVENLIIVQLPGNGIAEVTVPSAAKTVAFLYKRRDALVQGQPCSGP
jgi:hypothetical protein